MICDIICIEKPKASHKNVTFNIVAGYKINIQKSVALLKH